MVSRGSAESCFSHCGIQRDAGGHWSQVGQLGQQALPEWFDLSRVRGVIDGDGPDVDAVTLTGRGELLQRGGGAADDGVGGAVDRGDAQLLTPGPQEWLQSIGAQQDRRHGTGTTQGAQRLTAPRDDLGGLGQGKHPGDIGRGDLSLGVADHRVGNDAVAP